mmetsp:Transcript_88913/g.281431  ORF Transcript_88913/g.281431 Transcript_88913/m.281431 type:complete len:233 (+) Transcript_88913:640-1338(+)
MLPSPVVPCSLSMRLLPWQVGRYQRCTARPRAYCARPTAVFSMPILVALQAPLRRYGLRWDPSSLLRCARMRTSRTAPARLALLSPVLLWRASASAPSMTLHLSLATGVLEEARAGTPLAPRGSPAGTWRRRGTPASAFGTSLWPRSRGSCRWPSGERRVCRCSCAASARWRRPRRSTSSAWCAPWRPWTPRRRRAAAMPPTPEAGPGCASRRPSSWRRPRWHGSVCGRPRS